MSIQDGKLEPTELFGNSSIAILGLLPESARENYKNKIGDFLTLSTELELLVKAILLENDYVMDDYQDYGKRLFITDDLIEKKYKSLVIKFPEIGELIDGLVKLFPIDFNEKIKKSLIHKYLLDVFIEDMEASDFGKNHYFDLPRDGRLGDSKTEWEKYLTAKSPITHISFDGKLEEVSDSTLQIISKFLNNVRCITFSQRDIQGANADRLKILFGNLKNLRMFYCTADFSSFSLDELDVIFSKTKQCRRLYLRILNMSVEELEIMFKYSGKVNDLSIINNDISDFNISQLIAVFKNTENLKNLVLSGCNIGGIDFEILRKVFPYFKNCRIIYFSGNNMNSLSPDQLKTLFSNLTSIKTLYLNNNRFSIEQKEAILSSVSKNTYIKWE